MRLFFCEQRRDRAAPQRHCEQPGLAEFVETVKAMAASSERIAIVDTAPVSPAA